MRALFMFSRLSNSFSTFFTHEAQARLRSLNLCTPSPLWIYEWEDSILKGGRGIFAFVAIIAITALE